MAAWRIIASGSFREGSDGVAILLERDGGAFEFTIFDGIGDVLTDFSCAGGFSDKLYFDEWRVVVEASWLCLLEQTDTGSEITQSLSTWCLDDLLWKLHLCLSAKDFAWQNKWY